MIAATTSMPAHVDDDLGHHGAHRHRRHGAPQLVPSRSCPSALASPYSPAFITVAALHGFPCAICRLSLYPARNSQDGGSDAIGSSSWPRRICGSPFWPPACSDDSPATATVPRARRAVELTVFAACLADRRRSRRSASDFEAANAGTTVTFNFGSSGDLRGVRSESRAPPTCSPRASGTYMDEVSDKVGCDAAAPTSCRTSSSSSRRPTTRRTSRASRTWRTRACRSCSRPKASRWATTRARRSSSAGITDAVMAERRVRTRRTTRRVVAKITRRRGGRRDRVRVRRDERGRSQRERARSTIPDARERDRDLSDRRRDRSARTRRPRRRSSTT